MVFAIVFMGYIQVQIIFDFFLHRMTYYDIIKSKVQGMCWRARIISDNTATYVQTKKYFILISHSEKHSTSGAKQ